MAFVYEKIPEEKKESLEKKINTIKKEINKKNSIFKFFYYIDCLNYELPEKWTIDLKKSYIFFKCGSYEPLEPPLGDYSIQILLIKDYEIIIEVYDEMEGVDYVTVSIGKIYASKELYSQENLILKMIEEVFKLTWYSKGKTERFETESKINSFNDVYLYYSLSKRIEFVL